jgi:dTDP-L-rhamnose 4-epimerase
MRPVTARPSHTRAAFVATGDDGLHLAVPGSTDGLPRLVAPRPESKGDAVKRVLITGGAGFIGSHLADELLHAGYEVRALDNLCPQVHGSDRKRPSYLVADVELVIGDVCDGEAVRRALRGVDVVCHLAARVGVGQSMYAMADYTQTNNLGTAVLLEALTSQGAERLVVASSMSIYGEGLYRKADGGVTAVASRSLEQLAAARWELEDESGRQLVPVPTPEWKQADLASIYALSKYDQERMCLVVGRAYKIPTVAMRLFNVYGPRQALSNPYTGVLAIFAARLLNRSRPMIFEDGKQRRDFVSVHDVKRAFRLAIESPAAAGQVLNVGSGRQYTVYEIAERVAAALGHPHIEPEVTGKYRVGDIRHCVADITAAKTVMGHEPRVTLEAGIQELSLWLAGQVAIDRVGEAREELSTRGLTL